MKNNQLHKHHNVSPNPPLFDGISMKMKLIEELERGKKCAHFMRSLILRRPKIEDCCEFDEDYHKALDHHSMLALDTYVKAIAKLKSCDLHGDFVTRKRKLDHLEVNEPCTHEEPNGRRECYKRRKNSEGSREEEVTHLADDGFAWRKYGQKFILNSVHPRQYYRCTHRQEQKCKAMKQVQRISETPTKYRIIYNGDHTCTNNIILETCPFTVDNPPQEHSSAIIVSFGQTNSTRVSPLLFPTSAFPAGAVNQNLLSVSYGSNDDMTNPVYGQSDEARVAAENHSSPATSLLSIQEDYSFILADFSDLLPDLWTK